MPTDGYGNTLAGGNEDLTSDLFRAALMYWMSKQNSGPSGGTPNFYDVPLTPEQKRVEDEKWRIYQSGGTDAQKTTGAAARQFLSGMQSGPTSFEFMSPELKGKAFGGGIKFPTFDMSKAMPTTPGRPTSMTPNPNAPKFVGKNVPKEPRNDFVPDLGDTLPGPRYGNFKPGEDMSKPPLGMEWADGGAMWQKATSWWADYTKSHPNWQQLGPAVLKAALGAAFGLPGAVAGQVLGRLVVRAISPPTGSTPAPPGASRPPVIPPGGTPSDIFKGGV